METFVVAYYPDKNQKVLQRVLDKLHEAFGTDTRTVRFETNIAVFKQVGNKQPLYCFESTGPAANGLCVGAECISAKGCAALAGLLANQWAPRLTWRTKGVCLDLGDFKVCVGLLSQASTVGTLVQASYCHPAGERFLLEFINTFLEADRYLSPFSNNPIVCHADVLSHLAA